MIIQLQNIIKVTISVLKINYVIREIYKHYNGGNKIMKIDKEKMLSKVNNITKEKKYNIKYNNKIKRLGY